MIKNEWLKQRQTLVTGSDITFILKEFIGYETIANSYDKTRFQIYLEKTLPIETILQYNEYNQTPYMKEGSDRELEIASIACGNIFTYRANGQQIHRKSGTKIGATPDFFIKKLDNSILHDEDFIIFSENLDIEGEGLLECKLTYDFTDEKMAGYYLQLQHQMLCTGAKWGVIAVAVKEDQAINSKLLHVKKYFYKADESLHDLIVSACNIFWLWLDSVNNGFADHPKAKESNKRDQIISVFSTSNFEQLAMDYIEAKIAFDNYKDKYDAMKDKLQSLIGRQSGEKIITSRCGQSIKISQLYTKPSYWSEEDKQKEIDKLKKSIDNTDKINIGDIKTQSRLHKFSVEFI